MSAASSTAKGWLLPVVTATYGYALTKDDGTIGLLGIAGVLLFAMLDANYLRQEQAYRSSTSQSPTRPGRYHRSPSTRRKPMTHHSPDAAPPKKLLVWLGRWLPAPRVWLSWSIAPFYGGLFLIGLLNHDLRIGSSSGMSRSPLRTPSNMDKFFKALYHVYKPDFLAGEIRGELGE